MFEINHNLASHKVVASAFVFLPIRHFSKTAKTEKNLLFFVLRQEWFICLIKEIFRVSKRKFCFLFKNSNFLCNFD